MKCDNCGGEEWGIVDGDTSCVECGCSICFQKETKENTLDYLGLRKGKRSLSQSVLNKTTEVAEEKYDWDLREALTLLLRRYTDFVINMGASSELTNAVKTVWMSLLKSEKIVEKKPQRLHLPDSLHPSILISVIHTAMLLVNERVVQLSDLIRWLREENLPYISCMSVFPPHWKQDSISAKLFKAANIFWPDHKWARDSTKFYLDLLKLKPVALRDPSLLIKKQLEDFQLPGDMSGLVTNLFSLTAERKPLDILRQEELISAAAIIVALKLLFGLNGKKEDNLSKAASEYKDKIEGKELFVWNDWVSYIEIRKNIIRTFKQNTHHSNLNPFFYECNKYNIALESFATGKHIDENFEELKTLLKHFMKEKPRSKPSLHSSLGPLTQSLKEDIIKVSPEVLDKLLVNYYEDSTLVWLIHPENYPQVKTADNSGRKVTTKKVQHQYWKLKRARISANQEHTVQLNEKDELRDGILGNVVEDSSQPDAKSNSDLYWINVWNHSARNDSHNGHILIKHMPTIYVWLLELVAEHLQTTVLDVQKFVYIVEECLSSC